MACPKDFNSFETDKLVCSALAFAALVFRSRRTSPKVRAGHVPFGVDGWALPHKQALVLQRLCLQQVSRLLARFPTCVVDPCHASGLPSVCNLFHSAWTNSATWAVSYCNSRPFIRRPKAYALHLSKGGLACLAAARSAIFKRRRDFDEPSFDKSGFDKAGLQKRTDHAHPERGR